MSESLEDLLKAGKVRPVKGSLIGLKYVPDLVDTGTAAGRVKGEKTTSGLVLVQGPEDAEDALTKHTIAMVVALGEDPVKWESRFGFSEFDHKTTWADQRIELGTLVFVRAVAAAPLGVDSDFVQLRYDDIAGVGVPLSEDVTAPCYPAPGWLLVKLDEHEAKVGGIIVPSAQYAEVLQEGAGQWGTISVLPRNDILIAGSLKVGDRVLFPRYQLTEYIDLEGGFRLLPFEDVLSVEEEAK